MLVGSDILFGLKIESDPPEMESKDERSNQPGALEGSTINIISCYWE